MGSTRMTNGHNRRRFLQIAGTGAAASLAGCTDLGLLSGDDADDSLTVAVGPDQETIDDLMEQIESEEIDPLEAQQQYQEHLADAVSDFEERAEGDDELTIEESTEEMGLFRVEGGDETLLDALRGGEVTSLQTGGAYEQILEQQEQQQQPPEEPPEEVDPEDEDDSEDSNGDEADEDDGTDDGDESETGDENGDEDGSDEESDD